MSRRTGFRSPTFLFGAGIMILGIILLLNIFQAIGSKPILDSIWPILAFFAGLLMISMPDRTAKNMGAGFIVVGFLFSMSKLGVFSSDYARGILAVLIILVGIVFCVWAADRIGPSRPTT